MEQNTTLNYYRIKTEWTAEADNGDLERTKTEELVLATSYTEAEKVAYAIAEDQNRFQYGSVNIDIIKTKITTIVYNDVLVHDSNLICGLLCNFFEESMESEVGLYAVKVIYIITDEKTGKGKQKPDTIYIPAFSNSDATARVNAFMQDSVSGYIIRETKFDKCEAIYCSPDTYTTETAATN